MARIYHMNGPNRTKNDPSMVENRPMPYAEKDPLWKDTAFTSPSLIYFSATDFLVSYIFLPTASALAQKGIKQITGHNCRPRHFLLLGVVMMLVWKWNFHAFVGNTVTATLQSQRLGIHQQNRVGCFFCIICSSTDVFPLKLARSKTQFFFRRTPSAPCFFAGENVLVGEKKNMFFPLKPNPATKTWFQASDRDQKKNISFFRTFVVVSSSFFFKRRRRWGLLKP